MCDRSPETCWFYYDRVVIEEESSDEEKPPSNYLSTGAILKGLSRNSKPSLSITTPGDSPPDDKSHLPKMESQPISQQFPKWSPFFVDHLRPTTPSQEQQASKEHTYDTANLQDYSVNPAV